MVLVCPNTSLGHMKPTGCQLWRWQPQRSGNTKSNYSGNRFAKDQPAMMPGTMHAHGFAHVILL